MSKSEVCFQVFGYLVISLVLCTILLPVLNILAVSLSEKNAVIQNRVTIFPIGWETRSYQDILSMRNGVFLRTLGNTVFITVAGTIGALAVTVSAAYAMSTTFVGKKFVTFYFLVTMYFSGGVIPSYIINTNYFKLGDSYAILILPGLLSIFYVIVVRSQIEAIPPGIYEAASIDGATEFHKLFLITVPAIVPTIAAIAMFYALSYWNSWFNVMIYMRGSNKWTLQYLLRAIVMEQTLRADVQPLGTEPPPPLENFQMAAIVMVAAPIIAIYPFVQKYFVKGILSGAVKG